MARQSTDNAKRRLGSALRRGLAVCGLALLVAAAPGSAAPAGGDMAAGRAHEEAAALGRILIDVRSPQEWRDSGLPAGADAITIHQPSAAFLEAILAAVGGDRAKPIALICATGKRSTAARRFLEAQGFDNAVSVAGGLFGGAGWVKSGLPLEPCRSC